MPTSQPQGPSRPAQARPTLLAVSRRERFAARSMDYVLALAERLGADVLAAFVDPLPEYWGNDGERRAHAHLFAANASRNAEEFKARAQARGIHLEHVTGEGKVSLLVPRIYHDVKQIAFVLLEPDIDREGVASAMPVPVYSMVQEQAPVAESSSITKAASRRDRAATHPERDTKGASTMTTAEKKRQAYPRAAIFGILTAALYAAVFTNSGLVMDYFTRGGFYNLLPVATVFAFSYVHGSFAGNVWTALGINASNKIVERPRKSAVTRKQPRPRATLSA